jgi:hypothetical protein
MRCADCNKFVPWGDPNTDNVNVDIDGSELTLSGELMLTCGECGADIAAAAMDDSADVGDHFDGDPPDGQEWEYDLLEISYEPTERVVATSTPGRVKRKRVALKYIGVKAVATVARYLESWPDGSKDKRTLTEDITLTADEVASAFESCQ